MTVRLLAVSRLNLDRAWPEESPGVARTLRDTSTSLLLELVQHTLDLGVDAVTILGGLWDPTTVRSSTVDEVRAVLEAVPVPVIVLPDTAEAETSFRPHTLTSWPANVLWVGGEETVAVTAGSGQVLAQGPLGYAVPPLDDALALLTTRVTVASAPYLMVRPSPTQPAHSDTDEQPDRPGQIVEVSPLVAGSGTGRPVVQLISFEAEGKTGVEPIELSPHFGVVRSLDVGEHADSTSMSTALDQLLSDCDPLDRVVVTGKVGSRLLVPPALNWEPSRNDVTVLWRELHYDFPEAPTEHTVQAELIRRLAGPGPDPARRHQALAMGLASLDSEETTA